MDKTDRISFSKSFDLAGQNKLLKDPGQLYIAKTMNIGRFWADLGSTRGDFGGILGRLWGARGGSGEGRGGHPEAEKKIVSW